MWTSGDHCTLMELSAPSLFGKLQGSSSVAQIVDCCRIIAKKANVNGPGPLRECYPSMKNFLRSVWPAKHWLSAIDSKLANSIFENAISTQYKVAVIGGGPCGLRMAIEAQLMGATVTVIEKREWFSRNNALYLWPFVVTDLKSLGIKTFSKSFGAQQINLISVRQLQHSLLKIALLLGIEFHPNVEVQGINEPHDDVGWRLKVFPGNHPVANDDFQAVIGACGKPSDLDLKPLEIELNQSESHPLGGVGFVWRRINPKAKRAIGITANFIRDRKCVSTASNMLDCTTRQKDENDLLHLRNVETHFYYPCDTHYLIMCVSVECLMRHGILHQRNLETAQKLLSKRNIDAEKLKGFTKEFAKLVIKDTGDLEFAKDCHNKEDVDIFDFTWSWRAEPSSWIIERRGKTLFVALVGDSLIDPYWPSGSGTTKGFLGVFDTCWIMRKLVRKELNPIQLLAEKEALYGQLKKVQKQEHMRVSKEYTMDPASRYLGLSSQPKVNELLVCTKYFDSDFDHVTYGTWMQPKTASHHTLQVNNAKRQVVLNWCNERLQSYGMVVNDLSKSWKDGFALCGILHSLSPDIISFEFLSDVDGAHNNQMAINILAVLGVQQTIDGCQLSSSNMSKYESEFLYYLLAVITLIGEEKNRPSYLWTLHKTENKEEERNIAIQTITSSTDTKIEKQSKPKDMNQNAILLSDPIKIIPGNIGKEKEKASDKRGKQKIVKDKSTQTDLHKYSKKSRKGNKENGCSKDAVSKPVPGDMPIPKIYIHLMASTPKSLNEPAHIQRSTKNLKLPEELILWRSTSEPDLSLRPECFVDENTSEKSNDSDITNLGVMNHVENCCFCKLRVYPMERITANGRTFHKYCLQCEVCHVRLQLTTFMLDERNKFLCPTHCPSITASSENVMKAKIVVQNRHTNAQDLGWCIPAQHTMATLSKVTKKLRNKIENKMKHKVSAVPVGKDLIVAYDAHFSSGAEDEPETLQEHEWSAINFGIGEL